MLTVKSFVTKCNKLHAKGYPVCVDNYKRTLILFRYEVTPTKNTYLKCRFCSTVKKEVQADEFIQRPNIPLKIKRGPTELLETLSSTVGQDPTGHGYQFIDDPYLLPYTQKDREEYEAAHAYGVAAANMVFRNMPQLFHMDTAVPRIDSFYPHPLQIELKGGITALNETGWKDDIFYEGDQLDKIAQNYSLDEKIQYFVLTQKVEEAVQFYKALSDEQKNTLNDKSRSQLFDLLAYFGNVDREPTPSPVAVVSTLEQATKMDPSEENLEKISQQSQLQNDSPTVANMDKGCLAREVFETIEEKTCENYATMIKSLVKYNQTDEAFNLFTQKVGTEKLSFDVSVYNSILSCWNVANTFGLSYPQFVVQNLALMRDNGVFPDSNTFATVLRGIPDPESCEKLLLPTMKEMQVIGVKPSLAVYANFLRLSVFTRTRKYREFSTSSSVQPVSFDLIKSTLNQAIQYFDNQELLDSESDGSNRDLPNSDCFDFLPAAITVAYAARSPELAERLLKFSKRHPTLLKFQNDQNAFYKKYVDTIALIEDPRRWSAKFFAFVPTAYTPTVTQFTEEVFPLIENKDAYFCLPKLYDVLKLCGYAYRSQILLNAFCGLFVTPSEVRVVQVKEEDRIRIADEIAESLDAVAYNSRPGSKLPTKLNAQILHCLLNIYIECGQPGKATKIFLAGIRIVSAIRTTSFEAILETLWNENMLSEAEDFCIECVDLIPTESNKSHDLVECFAEVFSSHLPQVVIDQNKQGKISDSDLDIIKKNALATVERVQLHLKNKLKNSN